MSVYRSACRISLTPPFQGRELQVGGEDLRGAELELEGEFAKSDVGKEFVKDEMG